MNRRMANYGNQIVSNYPVRSTSYSPIKPRTDYSKLYNDISDLSSEIQSRKQHQKESQIITSLSTIANLINPPPKPKPDPAPSQDYSQILSAFQRQQEIMLSMIQNMSAPASYSTTKRRPKKPRRKRHQLQHSGSSSLSSSSEQLKRGPEEVKQILAELNFDDDGAEDFADQEKKLKFNSNLTDEEKYKLILQVEKNKKQASNVEYRLRGIRRFRKIGIVVLLPILLVSNMLEKRVKYYAESFKYMEEQLRVYNDVAQSWMIKVMRVALVSTVNDPDLDLILNNRESDIRNQSINTKIIKLQVRINGILEGLENYTNDKEMPGPFKSFISKLITDKNYVPPHFLTQFEKTRLDFNEFGGLINMNSDKKKMIICFFFIIKVMVKNICLKPSEAGIPIPKGSKTVENLKMIGSIFEIIVVLNFLKVGRKNSEVVVEELEFLKRKKGAKVSPIGDSNSDSLGEQVFFISEFEVSFNYIAPYIDLIRKRLFVWAGQMMDLCQRPSFVPAKKK